MQASRERGPRDGARRGASARRVARTSVARLLAAGTSVVLLLPAGTSVVLLLAVALGVAPAASGAASAALGATAATTTTAATDDAPAPRAPAARLARGVLLIADESLVDPNFRESVVLLLEHGPGGSLGVIVNRPTDVALSTVMPDVEELRRADPKAFLGGPVARDRMILLVRGASAPDGSARVLDDVWITPGVDGLRALAKDPAQDGRHRAYIGHAGWGAGQLEGELARGDWHVTAASAARVFTSTPERLWHELLETTRGRWVHAPATRLAALAPSADARTWNRAAGPASRDAERWRDARPDPAPR
jgi:putative transcriptional regulator